MRYLVYVILFVACVLSPIDIHSQTFQERINFELSGGVGLKYKGIVPIDFSFKFLVDIVPITYLFVDVEENVSLHSENKKNAYTHGQLLGGGIGLRMLNQVRTNHALDFRLKALGNIGKSDWKHTVYNASLAWYMKNMTFSPIVELGYRFLDSRVTDIKNYGSMYLSIGLRY